MCSMEKAHLTFDGDGGWSPLRVCQVRRDACDDKAEAGGCEAPSYVA